MINDFDFKIKNTFDNRKTIASNILVKYIYKIPVIIEKKKSDKSRHILDKNKYIMYV